MSRLAVVAAILAVLGLSVASGGEPAGAEGSFRAVAAASGLRVTLQVANAPATDTPFDAGGPVAQAVLDSLGTRDAYASSPYPGELVVLGPGLAAGFWGQTPLAGIAPPPSIPPYPFFVKADAQQPEAKQAQGISTLEATSAEDRTHARAASGTTSEQASIGSAVADSEVVRKPGADVVATASGDVESFAVGPLRLGSVHSRAVVVREADGTLVRESAFRVVGATVADVAVEVTPSGLETPGGNVPIGGDDQLAGLLEQAGITVSYVEGEDTADGVVGAGLRVTQTFEAPRFGVGGITYTLGQVSASVTRALDRRLPPVPAEENLPGDTSGAAGGDQGPATGSSAPSGASTGPTGGLGDTSAGLAATDLAGGFGATGGSGATSGSGASGTAASIHSRPPTLSTGTDNGAATRSGLPGDRTREATPAMLPGARSFGVNGVYLVGVLAALVLAAMAQLTGFLGVRGRWI